MNESIAAVLFDFGGVILASPFDAFAEYERAHGLPEGFLRRVNATNPDTNAWAKLERAEVPVDDFCRLFAEESKALGHEVRGEDVLQCLVNEVRPEMVEALRRCKQHFKTACLTNNHVSFDSFPVEHRAEGRDDVLSLFDVIVESSVVGVRKPDPHFYELACELLDVRPDECVFLDDLGVNLKPARALGMTTIKVVDAATAIAELEQVVGIPLREVAG